MKIKTLLISLSVIGFLSFSLTSCSNEQDMGIGGSSGETDPPRGVLSDKLNNDTIPSPENDSIAIFNLPND